ncbi:hypothetical protein D9611_003524 [Ephemerocybe angulata]|uniref:Uncharacterized protein n=1 Tax=Ephemerocybe angulata TaxID=980116 RepID=A0A8H5EYV5_9AGAR|nr:hypothetical protein D9611_003524 [Tulosesus angulatus]
MMPTTTRACYRQQCAEDSQLTLLETVSSSRSASAERDIVSGHQPSTEYQYTSDSDHGRGSDESMVSITDDENTEEGSDDPLELQVSAQAGTHQRPISIASASSSENHEETDTDDMMVEGPESLAEEDSEESIGGLSDAEQTIAELQDALRERDSTIQRLTDIVNGDGRMLRETRLADRCVRLERQLKAMENDSKEAEAVMTRLERECALSKSKLKANAARLEVCEAELRATQRFGTTADAVDVAEVARMVDRLNVSIETLASALGNEIVTSRALEPKKRGRPPRYVKNADLQVIHRWGEDLVLCMKAGITSKNPTIFVALVRNALSELCGAIIQAFSLRDGVMDDKLMELWAVVNENCEHAVAKRWRVITGSQLGPDDDDVATLTLSINERLEDLMVAAGWRHASKRSKELPSFVPVDLADIIARALEIRRTALEDVLSADLEALMCEMENRRRPWTGRSADIVLYWNRN